MEADGLLTSRRVLVTVDGPLEDLPLLEDRPEALRLLEGRQTVEVVAAGHLEDRRTEEEGSLRSHQAEEETGLLQARQEEDGLPAHPVVEEGVTGRLRAQEDRVLTETNLAEEDLTSRKRSAWTNCQDGTVME